MGSTRRSFTEEYKQQAERFVLDGQAVAAVAGNIGVHEMTLRNRVKKQKEPGQVEQKPYTSAACATASGVTYASTAPATRGSR